MTRRITQRLKKAFWFADSEGMLIDDRKSHHHV